MTQPRILVVDDEPSIVDALVYNLSKEGFDVSTAFDGREALAKCQSQAPTCSSWTSCCPPWTVCRSAATCEVTPAHSTFAC